MTGRPGDSSFGRAPDVPPDPVSDAEREQDRRALRILVLWLGGCAAFAALFLVLAIYLDWI